MDDYAGISRIVADAAATAKIIEQLQASPGYAAMLQQAAQATSV